MTTTFQLNASELDNRFIEAVKNLFQNQNIVISIESEPDTTTILNTDPLTRQQLTKAMTESRQGNSIAVDFDNLVNQIEQGTNYQTFLRNRATQP